MWSMRAGKSGAVPGTDYRMALAAGKRLQTIAIGVASRGAVNFRAPQSLRNVFPTEEDTRAFPRAETPGDRGGGPDDQRATGSSRDV